MFVLSFLCSVKGISLETAVPQNAGYGKALLVEQCECPVGYIGLSCEVKASYFIYLSSLLLFLSLSNPVWSNF